jgi:hypothetical protein
MGQFILAILVGTGSAVVLGAVYLGLLVLLKPALNQLRLRVHGSAPVRNDPMVAGTTRVSPLLVEVNGSVAAGVTAPPLDYCVGDAVYKLDPNYKLDLNYKLDPIYKLNLIHNCVLNPSAPLLELGAQNLRIAMVSAWQEHSVATGLEPNPCQLSGQLGSYKDLGQFIYVNAGVTLAQSKVLFDPAERHLFLTFSNQKTPEFQEPHEALTELAGIAVQGMPSLGFHFPQEHRSGSRVPSLAS